MKNLRTLDGYRDKSLAVLQLFGSVGNDTCGVFHFPIPGERIFLKTIAACGDGWEHVSVSTPVRCPTWEEMCSVKDLFFFPEDAVMQLHPPLSQYVNHHPYTLHLWRPIDVEIPLPPSIMVGPKA